MKIIMIMLGFVFLCGCSTLQPKEKPILLAIKADHCDLVLRWNAYKSAFYTIEFRTNLNDPWQPYYGLKAKKGEASVKVQTYCQHGFYRVSLSE